MKLLFEIEYRTQWGEQLVLLWGRRRIVLHYVGNGLWRGVCDAPRGGDGTTYRYTVEREGVCIRTEWRCHRLRLPRGLACREVRIRDRWQELPAGAAFLSSAFTRAVFARRQGRTEGAAEPRPVGKAPGGEVLLRVVAPDIRPGEQLAIASERLDGWQRMVPFDDGEFPEWSLRLTLPEGAAFKLLVIDRATGRPVVWEEGENRRWSGAAADGELLVEASLTSRLPERQWHGAGTAIPVFSLRSRESFGVGEFADLKLLIDWAAATRQRVIQLLPVNDTTMTRTWEDSYPYNANSIYALHPQFLRLTAAGVAEDEEYCRLRDELNALEEVDYERVNAAKERLLRATFARCGARTAARADYKAFVEANRHWLLPYAAYRCLRDEYGTADFAQWGPYARYERRKVEAYCLAHGCEVGYHCWVQYHLHLQLSEVSRYAHSRGIVLKGDLPIGIGRTSADAWQSPRLFHLDSQAGSAWRTTATHGGARGCTRWPNTSTPTASTTSSASSASGRFPPRRSTGCWATSIRRCPIRPASCAAWASTSRRGATSPRRSTTQRSGRYSASWPTRCGATASATGGSSPRARRSAARRPAIRARRSTTAGCAGG